MTTAAIRCLRRRFPDARIDMIVRSDFLDIIRHNPHLTHAIGLERKSGWRGLVSLVRSINSVEYDLIYDAHRSLRTRLILPFLRARQKARFQKHYVLRSIALLLKVPLLTPKRFLERFLEPLEPLGVSYDGLGPEMVVDQKAHDSLVGKLPALQNRRPRIGLVPSAQWPGKRWPVERFTRLAQKLVENTRYDILVFGGKEDYFCSQISAALPPDRALNAQGKLSILEAAAALKDCSFIIANDTGLMHVADALGVPSVLIFGPTSAELGCLPYHPLSRVVEHRLWCRPCSKNGQAPCIRSKRWCLEKTTEELVYGEALRLDQALLKLG